MDNKAKGFIIGLIALFLVAVPLGTAALNDWVWWAGYALLGWVALLLIGASLIVGIFTGIGWLVDRWQNK